MASITSLLNKKGWTGRELGRLELTNMAIQFKQAISGEEAKPLFSEGELQSMLSSIKDAYQGKIYNGYISIHEWLGLQYNIAQTNLQELQSALQALNSYLMDFTFSEEIYEYLNYLPYIITQKQYDELKEERIESYCKDEDGEELFLDVYTMLDRAIDFCVRQYNRFPKQSNPLKAILKKYEKEPVESERIRSLYLQELGEKDTITRFDILDNGFLLELYSIEDDKEQLQLAKEVSEEYRDAIEAILLDIKKNFPEVHKAIAGLPVEEWFTNGYTQRQLYNMDFYGTKEEAEGDFNVFNGNIRALINGVAILRPSDLNTDVGRNRYIDERGYYTEPELHHLFSSFSLEAFFTEAEEYVENTENATVLRKSVLDDYYFLLSYNYVMDRIAEIYEVPELDAFKMNIANMESIIASYNAVLQNLHRLIDSTLSSHKDKELQERKKETLEEFFQPVEIGKLAISDKRKDELEELLTDFKAFDKKNSDTFYMLMRTREGGENENEE